MALDPNIRKRLALPVICAPMFLVTGPALVREACKAGIIGGLPRPNARAFEEFESWLVEIKRDLDAFAAQNPSAPIAPVAVNIPTQMPPNELRAHLDACKKNGVDLIISAVGNPAELIARVHDWGGKVFHDITNMKFAEKAIRAGADGLTCIGSGGGGHSGTITHLALIPQVRAIFDGVVIMAGAVSTGAVVRAAEILGADLAYMGTRFIATKEADCPDAYKALLVSETSNDLMFTGAIAGVPANWMRQSIIDNGLDPLDLPQPTGKGMSHDHLPESVRPWKTLWSAGQGIDLIHDIPSVAQLAARLRAEYLAACAIPDMAQAARLTDAALSVKA